MTDTTSHPTPVQGEALPVVAKVVDTDITGARIVRVLRPVDIGTQLTDHAQATAEIAKRDAEILCLHNVLRPILERARSIEDAGPFGYGWRSDELQAEIAAADAVLARHTTTQESKT
jgi:hypothetical protein